jgi:hypothetical protein
MDRRFWTIVGCATAGLLAGLSIYQLQAINLPTMNVWGVFAFASLGTSLGCLLADPTANAAR